MLYNEMLFILEYTDMGIAVVLFLLMIFFIILYLKG